MAEKIVIQTAMSCLINEFPRVLSYCHSLPKQHVVTTLQDSSENRESQDSNPGLLGEKRKRFPCATQSLLTPESKYLLIGGRQNIL